MAVDLISKHIVPADMLPHFVWLGKQRGWVSYAPAPDLGDGVARNVALLDLGVLVAAPDARAHEDIIRLLELFRRTRMFANITFVEAASRLFADGPKLFLPTAEQFEAMQHVELHVPPSAFHSPYPALCVEVPDACRRAATTEFGVTPARVPRYVLVRDRREPGQVHMVVVSMHFGTDELGIEENFCFMDQPANATIEQAIGHRVKDGVIIERLGQPREERGESEFALVAARSAMNLCMMLTHYGHRLGAAPTFRNRADRRANEYRTWQAVELSQSITIRRPPPSGLNPAGPGTGTPTRPHWVRGHWRAFPGQAQARRDAEAAGTKVPLVFVRPYLTSAALIEGDLSEMSATYK